MGREPARHGAGDWRERGDQRRHGRLCLELWQAKPFTSNLRINRWINVAWLLVAWVVLQIMMGWIGNQQGYLLATPAHVGGFAAGLLLQRPLLLWRYRKA